MYSWRIALLVYVQAACLENKINLERSLLNGESVKILKLRRIARIKLLGILSVLTIILKIFGNLSETSKSLSLFFIQQ